MEQQTVAQIARVSGYYLSQLEKGTAKGANVYALIVLCDRMGLSLKDIVDAWEDFPETESNVSVVASARVLLRLCEALGCNLSDLRFLSKKFPFLYPTDSEST